MEIRRFYYDIASRVGDTVKIDGSEFLHMTKALRHKVGYKIILCDNVRDVDSYATITALERDFATAQIEREVANNTATIHDINFFIALPKGDKIDFIVQKAVELGVGRITPFYSSNVAEDKYNLERLERIAQDACKQCGRARKAVLDDVIEYDEALARIANFDLAIMAYEGERARNIDDISLVGVKSVAIIVGSEGGFTPQEIDKAKENGVKVITLGKRILRCETASLVTLTLAMYRLGEMR